MQAIMETIFDLGYLIYVGFLGFTILKKSQGDKEFKLFGLMTLILVFGDAFHLIPRVVALDTTGLQDYVVSLGIGKLVTSITMTIFYLFMYALYKERYVVGKGAQVPCSKTLDYTVYTLAAVRILLCLFPQNGWTISPSPLSWGIYRNIPFTIFGALIICLYGKAVKVTSDKVYRFMALAVTLSFIFYLIVVLFAGVKPILGMMMLPKTVMYIWIVVMGRKAEKEKLGR